MKKHHKPLTVLVTGSSGFIGANCVQYFLRQGARVYAWVRSSSSCWRLQGVQSRARIQECDLLNPEVVGKKMKKILPDVIVHAGSYGGFPHQNDPKRILDTNCFGTVNLLQACQPLDYKAFIHLGSSSEYGFQGQGLKEDQCPSPLTLYGVSKCAGTLFAQSMAKTQRKPVVILRLFSPYGYWEDAQRLIPALILSCVDGRPLALSSRKSIRDFIFIDDVLDAVGKALTHTDQASGEIFNIGSGREHSVGEVARLVMQLCKKRIPLQWGCLKNPRREPLHWEADITKARHVLGWKPRHTLQDGLKKTIDWFRGSRGLYL
jgi:nucleoside-diphosphate-sugar epimerase